MSDETSPRELLIELVAKFEDSDADNSWWYADAARDVLDKLGGCDHVIEPGRHRCAKCHGFMLPKAGDT